MHQDYLDVKIPPKYTKKPSFKKFPESPVAFHHLYIVCNLVYYKLNNNIAQYGLGQPLSEHEGGFGFGLIERGRRAADNNGGSTVPTQ